MGDTSKSAVIIFAKYPQPGKVKTRLSGFISHEKTVSLYSNMLKDLFNELFSFGRDLKIFLSDPGFEKKFNKTFGLVNSIYIQSGKDLGERMKNAFIKIFSEKYSKAVLIGSDIPCLDRKIILSALESISNKCSVIGPSFDGGYYMIGFSKESFNPEVFKNIEWSTGSVYEQTVKKFRKFGMEYLYTEKKRDIDTIEDVKFYFENSEILKYWKNTKEFLKRINFE